VNSEATSSIFFGKGLVIPREFFVARALSSLDKLRKNPPMEIS